MVGFILLGFFLVGNALARLVALTAPRSWCARIWDPMQQARPGTPPETLAYRRRLVLASAATYLWLGLWAAVYVLIGSEQLSHAPDRALLALILAFAVPLVGLVPLLWAWSSRPRG